MIDFSNLDYLKSGEPKQVQAYEVLVQNNILSAIVNFDPVLVGTIPLNIDIDNSDLDVICCWENRFEFIDRLKSVFGNQSGFSIREAIIDGCETVVANFEVSGFEIEIFGQDIPVKSQNGYKHMLAEYEILREKGEDFRLEIIKLKRQGYKTEPAFGKLLGLTGNPYAELLRYKI